MIQPSQSRRRSDVNQVIDQFNRRLTGWVLGFGLLTFHAGVFFLTITGLTFWNVYHDPTNFWMAGLLRRWGAVLVLHAVVTIGVSVGSRLLGAADIQEAAREHWNAPPIGGPVTEGSWRALESGRLADSPPLVSPSEPDMPRLNSAQRLKERAVRRVNAARGKIEEVSPKAAANWPEPPIHRDPEADELIRQFGNGDPIHPDVSPVDGQRSAQGRLTWVEAAATRWVTKKEGPEPAVDRKPRVATPPSPPPTAPHDDDPFAL